MTRDHGDHSHATQPGTSPDLQPLEEEGLTPSSRVEAGPLPYRNMKRVFDGTGQISGELFPSDSVAMPESWTLVIEPSQFAMGRETAIRKELEFPGNQTTFEVRDLPMASYRVYAQAEGQASMALEVSLFKIEGPGHRSKDHSHVMLQLQPLTGLDVFLRNVDLSPATELDLTLESTASRKRWQAQTNAAGRFSFERLPAGSYRLMVGYADQPLVPEAEIQVDLGQVATWQGTLPATYSMNLKVIDDQGRPLPEAILRGHGGAPIAGRTDFDGMFTQRYLPQGTYRIRVEHKESEGKGHLDLVLPMDPSQPDPVVVYCRP